ncbi:hypothetical protein TrRE_jg1762, partial [Triparma retinervis]
TLKGDALFGPVHDPLESFTISHVKTTGSKSKTRLSYKFVSDPILNASIAPRLFLAGYIKALLLPPGTALEDAQLHPLPGCALTPPWVGWKTKGLVTGLDDCKRARPSRKFDIGKLFNEIKETDEEIEDGIPSPR